jgi:hypothetical protein
MAAYALDSQRPVIAVSSAIIALAAHENIAFLLVTLALYWIFLDRSRKAALVVLSVSVAYFIVWKAVVLPRVGVDDVTALTSAYRGLFPNTNGSYWGLFVRLLSNPWHVVFLVDDTEKLRYAAQILVPLALVPLRGAAAALLIPAVVLSLLAARDPVALSIHSQMTAYWTPMVFLATVLVLGSKERSRGRALEGALIFCTVLCALQFGASPFRR